LLLEPSFYVRWLNMVQDLMGDDGPAARPGQDAGLPVAQPRLLLGLWVGYAIYGLTLPYQMYTHNYYHARQDPDHRPLPGPWPNASWNAWDSKR
jgi:hypothetical protein